jgi:glycosyltransferase involved in cell wall biosynthesis
VRLRRSICTIPEMITYVFGALSRAFHLAKTHPYAINHTHFIFPDGIVALLVKRLCGLPYVITAHGSDVPGYNPNRFRMAHRLLTPLWRLVVQEAEEIVCPSQTLRALVQRRSPSATTAIIPNGIDVTSFRADQPKQPRVLVVSRLFERKGVQHVLSALAELPPGWELHIVGEGPYLPTLQQVAERFNTKPHWHGWLENPSPELSALLETSSVFVFPSEAENFPMVLLEAMAAGTAIVTTEGTGCAEVVGDAALLVPPRDPAAIRSAVLRLLQEAELRQRLGEAARRRLQDRFAWDAVAAQYVDVYLRRGRAPAVAS